MKLFMCLMLGSMSAYGATTGTTTTTTSTTTTTTAPMAATTMTSTYIFNSLLSEGMDEVDALNIALTWHAPMAVPHYYGNPRPERKDNTR
jgi:hypothetical protein